MLLTVLSMLGGGFMRLLPELIGLWNKKEDNDHERQMLDKQIELEKLQSADRLAEKAQQFDAEKIVALMDAQKEALTGQMQKTGIRFVDALNFLVRPLTTYYFLAMFGIYKAALLGQALTMHDTAWQSILAVYTPDDASMLSGILAFWFVGRVFDKQK